MCHEFFLMLARTFCQVDIFINGGDEAKSHMEISKEPLDHVLGKQAGQPCVLFDNQCWAQSADIR